MWTEVAISASKSNHESQNIARLLAGAAVVRSACDLDLLVFLYRHPRTLLTSEQLTAFVGYPLNRIAESLDAFTAAGILERTQSAMHAARMYLLELDGPQGEGLRALLELAFTRPGRQNVLQSLDRGRSPGDARVSLEKPRLLRIA